MEDGLSEEMSDELDEMRPYLCLPLQYTHYTWRPILRQISETLLRITINRDNTPKMASDAFNCHIILPGLVQGKRNQIIAKRKNSKHRNSSSRVLDFLNGINSHTDPISAIYEEAQSQYRSIQKRKWNKRVPTVGSQKRKCEKLIGEGRFSTAMNQVATIIDLEEGREIPEPKDLQTIKDTVHSLHPQADERDLLPELDCGRVYPEISFDMEELVEAVSKLNFGSAPGSSGWSFRSMDAILSINEGDDNSHLKTILNFFNRAVAGDLPTEVFQIWATSRSVLIPKNDNAFRPLGIGECFLRLLSKMLNDKVKTELGERLAPLQLCVGIKGGAEIGARLAHKTYGSDKLPQMKIDIVNAFNSIPRELVLKGLERYYPGLIPFYTALHSSASPLCISTGETVGFSSLVLDKGIRWQ
jgi:hypothetical protein